MSRMSRRPSTITDDETPSGTIDVSPVGDAERSTRAIRQG